MATPGAGAIYIIYTHGVRVARAAVGGHLAELAGPALAGEGDVAALAVHPLRTAPAAQQVVVDAVAHLAAGHDRPPARRPAHARPAWAGATATDYGTV